MKRKGKIITTIASLCLAVALMAFGVYAATQVTMGVTSRVKFEVTDVFVTVSGATYSGHVDAESANTVSAETVTNEKVTWTALTDAGVGHNTEADPADGITAAYAAQQTYTTNANGTKTPINPLGDVGGVIADWNAGTFPYTSTEVWYKLELTIVNDAAAGDDSVYVQVNKVLNGINNTVKASTYEVNNEGAKAVAAGTELTAATVIEIEPGKTAKLTFVRRVLDTSKNIPETSNFADNTMTLTIRHTAA